uniref:Uncharacterized protein n=1 Tax=Salix viminalis TaxID=40686 RepID=A0A6N2KX47_SALVM
MTSFSLSSKAYTARDFILEAKKNPQTTFSSYFVFDRNSGWVKFRTTTTTNKYKANTHVEKASKGGFNNNVWVNQLAKSFKIDKSVNRLKPAVAFSDEVLGLSCFPLPVGQQHQLYHLESATCL